MNRRTLIIGAVTAASVASIAGASLVSAQTAQNNPGTTIVDKIASRFNLNRDDVQKVFEEEHKAHEAQHRQEASNRLDQAVSNGKLTQAQADMIKAKMSEMESFMDSLKDKSHDERHDAMEPKREELKKWADENNIPMQYLMPMGKGMGGHHRGGMHGGPSGSES